MNSANRRDPTPLEPLRARRESTGRHHIWSLARAEGDESCRWKSWDGRWVAITIGSGAELGTVVVACSDGRRESTASYEDALALARSWRQ